MSKKAWVDIINDIDEGSLVSVHSIDKIIKEHEASIEQSQLEIELSTKSIKQLTDKKKNLPKNSEKLFIFGVAERLELLKTICGSSLFPPHEFNWVSFIPEQEIHDAEHIYYVKAQQFIKKASESGINIHKALELSEWIVNN